jgi:hypothetical protein
MLQGDVTDRVDPTFVRMLLGKAAEIVPLDVLTKGDLKGAVSLEALELKNPKRTITLSAGKKRTLSFGIPGSAAGQTYARIGNGNEVFLISSELEHLAFRPENAFRDSRLTIFSPERVSEMTFSKNGGLERLTLSKETGRWRLAAPAAVAADQDAAEAWANSLLAAKIEQWLPAETDPSACGLDTPAYTITVHGDGVKDPVTISVGSQVPGAPEKFYLRCSGRPGICVVSGISPSLQVTARALRTKQLKRIELDAVDKVQINQPKGPDGRETSAEPLLLTRKRGGEDWEIRSGGSGDLPGAQVRAWHEALMQARARGFEPATPEKIRQYGLDAPTEIRLVARLSENSAEENAGEIVLGDYLIGPASHGIMAIREGNSPELMIMPEGALTPLGKAPATSPSPMPVPNPTN